MKWRVSFLWTNHDDAQEICNGFQELGGRFIEQGYAELLHDEDDSSTGLYAIILTFESEEWVFNRIYRQLNLPSNQNKVKWVKTTIEGLPGLMARE